IATARSQSPQAKPPHTGQVLRMSLDAVVDRLCARKSLHQESTSRALQEYSGRERKAGPRQFPGSPTVVEVSSRHSHAVKARFAFQAQDLATVLYSEWSSAKCFSLTA